MSKKIIFPSLQFRKVRHILLELYVEVTIHLRVGDEYL